MLFLHALLFLLFSASVATPIPAGPSSSLEVGEIPKDLFHTIWERWQPHYVILPKGQLWYDVISIEEPEGPGQHPIIKHWHYHSKHDPVDEPKVLKGQDLSIATGEWRTLGRGPITVEGNPMPVGYPKQSVDRLADISIENGKVKVTARPFKAS